MTIYKPDVKYFLITAALLLLSVILYIYYPADRLNSGVATVLGAVFLVKFRKSIPLLLLFVFIFSYIYESTKYFYGGIMVAPYKDFNKDDIINKVLLTNSIFVFTLGNMISARSGLIKMNLSQTSFKSVYIFWILVTIGIYIIIFGIRGQSLLSGAGYGTADKSTLHEYFILLFFLLLLTRPDNNIIARFTVFVLYGVYCFKTLIYGGRVEVLQVTLLLVFFYWILPQKVGKVIVFIGIGISLYVSAVVSNIRTNPILLLKGEYATLLNPIADTKGRTVLNTNQGDVIYSSARLTGMIDQGIIIPEIRAKSFITFMASIVVTTNKLPEYANLAGYRKVEYGAGGGGLIGTFFYVWFGYLGPAFIGLFLGYCINRGFRSSNIAMNIYAVILLVMVPRWYAYGPIIVFKLCLYTVVMYLVFKLIFKIFFKRSTFTSNNLVSGLER